MINNLSQQSNGLINSDKRLTSQGDNIVAARALYGGTFTMFNDLLPKFGITVKFVDAEHPQNFVDAMDE
jgi:O-acetylhomoserine (thiol)-lyase